jgi:hypothetical protein
MQTFNSYQELAAHNSQEVTQLIAEAIDADATWRKAMARRELVKERMNQIMGTSDWNTLDKETKDTFWKAKQELSALTMPTPGFGR